MTYYCGIDLGAIRSELAIIDNEGKTILRRTVHNLLPEIIDVLRPFQPGLRIVVESTFNWYWLVDGLKHTGHDVVLAHTYGLALITRAKVKTDRRDALALARLLRLDAIPTAYIYPPELRPVRDLLRRRLTLVRMRGNEFGSIRRLLMRHGELDHSRHSVTQLTDDELAEMLTHPLVYAEAEQHRERIQLYSEQLQVLEQRVLRETELHRSEDFRRLNTLPGVSTILALTILYETGDVSRFASPREYSSYCRVVPALYQSGSVQHRRSRASKQGNPNLKWAFNQAALHAVRNYPVVRGYFDRQLAAHVGPAGKVVVYNTVAHKLAVAAYRVLRDVVDYDERRLFGT